MRHHQTYTRTTHTRTHTYTHPDISEEKFPGLDATITNTKSKREKEKKEKKAYLNQVPTVHNYQTRVDSETRL